MEDEFAAGTLVRHRKMPQWGLGKIVQRKGSTATIFFVEDRDKDVRPIAIDRGLLEVARGESHPILDNLPPFVDGAFVASPRKVTLGAGIEHFMKQFPRGFDDPRYLGDSTDASEEGERNYKLAACDRYRRTLGDGRAEKLLEVGEMAELIEGVCSVVSKGLNLLSPFESMALRDGMLADEASARRFLGATFDFIGHGSPEEGRFQAVADALLALPVAEGKARVATWPVATILPFLADPQAFMFLKPEPTKECAERLRLDLQYDSAPRWVTYKKLMELSRYLLDELRPLGARDYIDVQSFIWVIAKYE